MEAVSTRARVYVACVTVAALFCLLPLPGIRTPWWAVALLAALYAGFVSALPGPGSLGSPTRPGPSTPCCW